MEHRKTVYAWTAPFNNPDTLLVMGRQKNEDGTGFHQLIAGDEPRYCEYCDQTISDYPHTHTKEEYDNASV